MPEFVMDGTDSLAFQTLDSFTRGYIEALFFTDAEPGTTAESHDPEKHFPLHGNCGFEDIAAETLAKIVADCRQFQADYFGLLLQAYERGRKTVHGRESHDQERAGRDFWFTRNGHGVGFWDRGLGEIGDKLSTACGWRTMFPECDSCLCNDGKVYLS